MLPKKDRIIYVKNRIFYNEAVRTLLSDQGSICSGQDRIFSCQDRIFLGQDRILYI